jgi:hypothetical protein
MPCSVRIDFSWQPGMRPGPLCVWPKFLLKPIPTSKMVALVGTPPGVHSIWGRKTPDAMHLGRRVYAGILCELWGAIDRRIL